MNDVRAEVITAIHACEAKKASDISILKLAPESSGFTDYFIICSGSNSRQIQAISDEIDLRLSKAGTEPRHIEGYEKGDWVLMDYVDFVVHIFSEQSRRFYDLERLWKSANKVTLEELEKPARKPAKKAVAARPASKRANGTGRTAKKKAAPKKSSRAKHR